MNNAAAPSSAPTPTPTHTAAPASVHDRPQRLGTGTALLLGLAAAALYLINAPNLVLMDPDEARCALIAQDMIDRGDWLVPRVPYGFQEYFDRPVLYFWMLIAAMLSLGSNELALRGVSALGAGVCVAATYQLGRVLLSPRAGLWAALLLATSGVMFICGRFVRMDIWFTAFIALGVLFWARVHFAGRSRWNLLVGYAALAAALLTKGLVGLGLPLGAIGLYLVWRRDWRAIPAARPLLGLLVIAALGAPWFIYMQVKHPGFNWEFFVRHHVSRAVTDEFGKRGPGWYYMPAIMLAGMLPWTGLLIGGMVHSLWRWKDDAAPRPAGLPLVWFWALLGVAPYTLINTQFPIYILPAFPALALLAGYFVDWLLARPMNWETRLHVRVPLILMGVCIVGLWFVQRRFFGENDWLAALWRVGLAAPFVLAALWLLSRRRTAAALVAALCLPLALSTDYVLRDGPRVFAALSSKRFVEPTLASVAGVDELVIGPFPRYALPFYLRGALPIRLIKHVQHFEEFVHERGAMLGLISGQRMVNLARDNFGERMRIITQEGLYALVRIEAAPEASAAASSAPAATR